MATWKWPDRVKNETDRETQLRLAARFLARAKERLRVWRNARVAALGLTDPADVKEFDKTIFRPKNEKIAVLKAKVYKKLYELLALHTLENDGNDDDQDDDDLVTPTELDEIDEGEVDV